MPTYAFQTITAAQALGITAGDAVLFTDIPANQVTVVYNQSGTITVSAVGRTVEFGAQLGALGAAGRLPVSETALLFIGDANANVGSAQSALAGNDGFYGGGGDDTLSAGLGDDLLQGNTGADYLIGGGGRDVLYGGQDNDRIVTAVDVDDAAFPANDGGDFAQGNRGDDVIIGSRGADTLLGGQGADTVSGQSGAADYLNGNLGDDRLQGQGVLMGEGGADTLIGGGAADTLLGGDGLDRITFAGGYVDGGESGDLIEAGAGAGDAIVLGGGGADTLQGVFARADAHLSFSGGEGADSLFGSHGVDTLSGDAGNDTIDGFGGADRVAGGEGQDRFHIQNYARNPTSDAPSDPMSIVDWEAGDRLDFLLDGFGAGRSTNYREITADSYDAAFAAAGQAAGTPQEAQYVAVQVGVDVVVFGFAPGGGVGGVILVGRTLADVDFTSIV